MLRQEDFSQDWLRSLTHQREPIFYDPNYLNLPYHFDAKLGDTWLGITREKRTTKSDPEVSSALDLETLRAGARNTPIGL